MRYAKLALVVATAAIVVGCATSATTEHMQNLETETQQVPMGYVAGAVESGACVALSEHRFQGKVGFTLSHDLQMLADEIDSVVRFNGGDAYAVEEWQWVVIDAYGSTAPVVKISVLDCSESDAGIEQADTLKT